MLSSIKCDYFVFLTGKIEFLYNLPDLDINIIKGENHDFNSNSYHFSFVQFQSTEIRPKKQSATVIMHSGITVYTVIYVKYHTTETSKI